MSVLGDVEAATTPSPDAPPGPAPGSSGPPGAQSGAAGAEPKAHKEPPAHRAPSGRKIRPQHLMVVHRRRLLAPGTRAGLTLTATVGLILLVVFGLVGLHVLMEQTQLRLDRLQTNAAGEQLTYEHLRLQVDQLESPSRIVAVAESRLGMEAPATITYLKPVLPGPVAATGKPSLRPGGDVLGTSSLEDTTPSGPADWPSIKSQLDRQP